MEIREVARDDWERAIQIGVLAFAHGRRGRSTLEDESFAGRVYGAYEGGALEARLVVLPYRTWFGPDSLLEMGGIAGVACMPASRGKGYAGELLRDSLVRMREAGQVVSTLFPFSVAYYERFGWEWTGINRSYEAQSGEIPDYTETRNVRTAEDSDREAILGVYERFARRYRGMVARTERMWERIFNHSDEHLTYRFLYVGDSGPEGYLVYRGGEEDKTEIREFIAISPAAQRGLLGALKRLDMQVKRYTWNGPADDTLWSQFMTNDLQTRLSGVTMARVVDLRAALEAWRPSPEACGSVTFAVADEQAPWNDGTWLAEFGDGAVEVRRSDQEPQVSMDIQAFSQAFYGTPTAPELRVAGRLRVHDEAGFGAFRALLAGPLMWMHDWF